MYSQICTWERIWPTSSKLLPICNKIDDRHKNETVAFWRVLQKQSDQSSNISISNIIWYQGRNVRKLLVSGTTGNYMDIFCIDNGNVNQNVNKWERKKGGKEINMEATYDEKVWKHGNDLLDEENSRKKVRYCLKYWRRAWRYLPNSIGYQQKENYFWFVSNKFKRRINQFFATHYQVGDNSSKTFKQASGARI